MNEFKILSSASFRIDEIYSYTASTWGSEQADKYLRNMFDFFQEIANQNVVWKKIPAHYLVDGFYNKYEQHFVYWKILDSKEVGITAILHERMDQINRLREDFV